MKLNISNPLNNVQKSVEVDDDKKLLPFFEKRIGSEVPADSIGEEFAGYVFRITGGNDKQGFPMLQGVLTNHRVRLLLREGMKCYRPRRDGERKRKSVRGCIVGHDISALNVVIVKKGNNEIPGLTDKTVGKKLGPKRANKIRKLFNLTKEDDVKKYVIGRVVKKGNKNKLIKPKIQRLVTEKRLSRRERANKLKQRKIKERRKTRKEYKKILKTYREGLKASLKSKQEEELSKTPKKKQSIKTRKTIKKNAKPIKKDAKTTKKDVKTTKSKPTVKPAEKVVEKKDNKAKTQEDKKKQNKKK